MSFLNNIMNFANPKLERSSKASPRQSASSVYFDTQDRLKDSELWPEGIKINESILTENEQVLVQMLLSIQQHHLFDDWEEPGVNDDLKHEFFMQIARLHHSYPSPGGLVDYVTNARKLLLSAKLGENPLAGFKPEVPTGEILEPLSPKFVELEKIGMKELGKVGFVLVAGGLGERLGYSGIKVALPSETVTGTCYLELYCQTILAIQSRYGSKELKLPLAIMTSDDTYTKTISLLNENNFFGLNENQVTILRQEKVAALSDNLAHISRLSTYEVEAKPHGHGDVHSLMFSSGAAAAWLSAGIRWVFFFQDTNGLAFFSLAAQLGVSILLDLEVNSMTVPRIAKQAVGAITKLVRDDGTSITVNVEYNQLEPLLISSGGDGDVNDPVTGLSPFPGNINQLLLSLSQYVENLNLKHGIMSEFVNPKYADKEKTTFKKPTRLECMMQDYPKTLDSSAKVGFTMVPAWFCFSPCKNNTTDAAAALASGIPANSAFTAESDQFNVFSKLLSMLGATISFQEPIEIMGVKAVIGPQIIVKPSTALFASELMQVFPTPEKVSISQSSSLIVEGVVEVKSLQLDGALQLIASEGSRLIVHAGAKQGGIRNSGRTYSILDPSLKQSYREVDFMRGYVFSVVKEEVVITPSSSLKTGQVDATLLEASVYTGRNLIPGSAYDDEETIPSNQSCGICFPGSSYCS